jgi:hypothetical protein
MTYIVSGGYWEHLKDGSRKWRGPGYFTIRRPKSLHKLELPKDMDGFEESCLTLFFRGPRVREWGFNVDGKWMPWNDYLNERAR